MAEKKNTKLMKDLVRVHARAYQMTVEDSEQIVQSVLDAIKETMMDCDALMLVGFGKFEHVFKKPYIMVDNRPGQGGVEKRVPPKYKMKFTPSPLLNDVSFKYHQRLAARGEL